MISREQKFDEPRIQTLNGAEFLLTVITSLPPLVSCLNTPMLLMTTDG